MRAGYPRPGSSYRHPTELRNPLLPGAELDRFADSGRCLHREGEPDRLGAVACGAQRIRCAAGAVDEVVGLDRERAAQASVHLGRVIGVGPALPELAGRASARGAGLEVWSAGCASGEEAYTLALIWQPTLGGGPAAALHVLATDVDETMLRRARAAQYPASSLRELPETWRQAAFVELDGR